MPLDLPPAPRMSLVGFRAKNHPQQPTRDDVDDRRTPLDFWQPLHAEHCFTVDAAASAENALLPVFWTLGTNALEQEWTKHRVWCNPPYSNIGQWVDKAWCEMRNDCESIVMLLPANRCEQRWWQELVEPFRDRPAKDWEYYDGVYVRLSTRFLAGRMRFDWPATRETPAKGDRPPFGLVLLTWELGA